MTTIRTNTDLNDGVINSLDGWETSAAKAFKVVIYTCNLFAAYSDDEGHTFHAMDLWGLCGAFGEKPIGDQVVIYIPQINQFAWVIMTQGQNLVLALASPTEVEGSKGKQWITWRIPANQFEDGVSKFDQPTVAVGDNFLYLTCNLGRVAIALRLSIAELFHRGTLHLIYFVAPDVFWLKPALSTGETGYFAALLADPSRVRVFSWTERTDRITFFDLPIATIPTEDGTVKIPNGEWLSNQRGALQVLGLTRTGTQLWAAWFANRKVAGQTANAFDQPHIEIAIIDVQGKRLVRQQYIWNPDFAFAFPALATNVTGDVGLSFCWGGPRSSPQYGVGIITGRDQRLFSVTSGDTAAAGGDYTTIRMSFPDVGNFCAAGFNQVRSDPVNVNHPHYVLFGP